MISLFLVFLMYNYIEKGNSVARCSKGSVK